MIPARAHLLLIAALPLWLVVVGCTRVAPGSDLGLALLNNSASPAETTRSQPGFTILESGDATSVNETGTTSDAYSIRLNTEPAADVTLSIAFDPNQIRVNGSSVSPAAIVFNSTCPSSLCWSTARNIIVTAVDDALFEIATHTSSISHSSSSNDGAYNGLNINGVTAFILDNEGDVTSPTVTMINPVQGVSVGTNVSISVTFSEPMNPGTLSVNTTNTACVNTIQMSLSADFFATNTCIQMAASPAASNGNRTFTFKPAVNLNPNEVYDIRVTTVAADPATNPLATQFTTVTGLFTGALADSTDPVQSSPSPFNPANNAADVSPSTSITIAMDEFMLPASMTTNLMGDTTCSGTFQVSLDNFAGCVPMQSQPVPGANHSIWTITPLAPLLLDTNYRVRLTGAQDAAGNTQSSAINWDFDTAD